MSKSTFFSDFKIIDSIFSDAVGKFQENKQFAYLCSLLILNSNNLITDPQSKLLYKHFNYDSDLVTILEYLYEISETESEDVEDNGLNYFTISFIYSQIEKAYDVKNGRMSVFQTINWAKSQQDGILGNINKFINCLNQPEFVDKRKCQFKYVCNASPESIPLLVYKTKDDKEIDIYRRPGCHGLQSPGNIIVLSIHGSPVNNKLHGILIHHDTSEKNENLGIVSVETYNNIFFFKLYEAYMNEEFFSNKNFKKIYRSNIKNDQNTLKIYINNEGKCFLSYCPLNSSIDNSMKTSIEFINSLIPFVPRSLLINFEKPNCIVEMIGYGAGMKYTTSIYLDSTELLAYQINKETLEYAQVNINELKKDLPKVRFALTGENFLIKNDSNENAVDQQFSYPDASDSIKSVFDPNHTSHLVLLVSNEYANKPKTLPLSFTSNEETIYKRPFMHSKWNYNEFSFPLINNNDDDENTTCLYMCDSLSLCQHPLFVYEKDGTTKEFKICKSCLKLVFEEMEEIKFAIDPTDKKILFDKIDSLNSMIDGIPLIEYEYDENSDSTWPQIPLGQIMFTLMSDDDSELIKYLKIWFTLIINKAVFCSKYFIRCPNHPKIFHKKPDENESFKCPYCDFLYCTKCKEWHNPSNKCIVTDNEAKRCPNCGLNTIKVSGFNRISCPKCGKHWCYKCSKSPIFDTVQECYQHLKDVHGGYDT